MKQIYLPPDSISTAASQSPAAQTEISGPEDGKPPRFYGPVVIVAMVCATVFTVVEVYARTALGQTVTVRPTEGR